MALSTALASHAKISRRYLFSANGFEQFFQPIRLRESSARVRLIRRKFIDKIDPELLIKSEANESSRRHELNAIFARSNLVLFWSIKTGFTKELRLSARRLK